MRDIKTYSELSQIESFIDRYRYLQMNGTVCEETFGFDRVFNQMFYCSKEWRRVRNEIIVRDNGCDLGVEDHEIRGIILIHHMNPISIKDIERRTDILLDPEYLITTFRPTHLAIHYGNEDLLPKPLVERTRNDTCPWRHN